MDGRFLLRGGSKVMIKDLQRELFQNKTEVRKGSRSFLLLLCSGLGATFEGDVNVEELLMLSCSPGTNVAPPSSSFLFGLGPVLLGAKSIMGASLITLGVLSVFCQLAGDESYSCAAT